MRDPIHVQKVRDVRTPSQGTWYSAGIDFYVPNDIPYENLIIGYRGSLLVPLGIKVSIPQNHALIAFNKSGVATKKGLQVGACVVDEDYEGEIHAHFFNLSPDVINLTPGEKIIQFLLIPVTYPVIVEKEELIRRKSTRGEGGFGSTSNK